MIIKHVDDVLIASRGEAKLRMHVLTVLERFNKFGIAIILVKCETATSSIAFLRHVIDANAGLPNPKRLPTIRQRPVMSYKKDLQRFF